MKVITETKRLIIREISEVDIDVMLELHSDPEVHKYLGNKLITSKEKIANAIDSIKKQYMQFNVGRWAMIDKKTKEFIGWTGLEFVTKETNNHINYYDLGYRLLKRFWGKGLATESAFASIDYLFNKLNKTEVYAMTDNKNKASDKILRKVGLNFTSTFNLEGVKYNWYRLNRSEYLNQKVYHQL